MNWVWLAVGIWIGCIAGVLLAALFVMRREKHICSGCEIWENPDSDYRQCFDCKRGEQR